METFSSIVLSASVSVPANATRGVSDTSSLQNPFRTAILLDEIRFQISNGSAPTSVLADLFVDLKIGRSPLTNGFVPVWTLGKQINSFDDAYQWTWRLPKPLYVPATEFVVPVFYHTAVANTVTMVARITYAGRALASDIKPPQVVHMPWATSFIGVTRAGGSDFTDLSAEGNLVNPFNEPLHVQRFNGQLYADTNPLGATEEYTLVKMSNSEGRISVRDPTPWAQVFHQLDKAWTVNTLLKPKGFYIVELDENYTALADAVIKPMVTMIGHRDVVLNG